MKGKRRKNCFTLIVFIVVVILLILYLLPQMLHPQCVLHGGYWRMFPDTCGDSCGALACGQAFTPNCDCGSDKCWDGKRCVSPPEKHCEQDNDCLTSCGMSSGNGHCYNREYVQKNIPDLNNVGESPIDGTCCMCDYVDFKVCKCINDYCREKRVN